MRRQIIFSERNKNNLFNVSSAEFTHSVQSVKVLILHEKANAMESCTI